MSFIRKLLGVVALIAIGGSALAATDETGSSRERPAQRRTSITVYPRHVSPGPYATRHCDAWLAKEYRASGPVVTPQMRCYWQ